MTPVRNHWRLFGFDLHRLYEEWCAGWQDARRWRWFNWLFPDEPVRLLQPDGSTQIWQAGKALPDHGARTGKVQLWRVLLPDEDVLGKTLYLPRMSGVEIAETVYLETLASSPFPDEQLIRGWHHEAVSDDRYRVDIAMASRRHVENHLAMQQARLQGATAEVAALVGGRQVLLQGYGGNLRQRRARSRLGRLLFWLVLVLVLLLGLNLIPAWQERQKTIRVMHYQHALETRVQETSAARDRLREDRDHLQALTRFVDDHSASLAIIEKLSGLLPDDAWLDRLHIENGKVQLSGRAGNASGLVQLLDRQSEYRDVRLSGSIVREAGDRERFTIEFAYGEPQQP